MFEKFANFENFAFEKDVKQQVTSTHSVQPGSYLVWSVYFAYIANELF